MKQKLILKLIAVMALFSFLSCDDGILEKLKEDVEIATARLLELTVTASDHGTVEPSGSVYVAKSSPYEIAAIPDDGYRFSGWEASGGEGITFGNAADASTTVTLSSGNASVSANFEIYKIGDVTFSPEPGTFYETTTIYLSTDISDADIYYTLDETEPTETSGTLYDLESGITLSNTDTTTVITAAAYKSGLTSSSPSAGTYSIYGTVNAPVITSTPDSSEVSDYFTVTMSSDTSGVDIYYTIDGSVPDSGSTLYSGSFDVTENTTVRAVAQKNNWLDSAIASEAFITGWAKASGTSSYTETGMSAVQGTDGYIYVTAKSSVNTNRRLYKYTSSGNRVWGRVLDQAVVDTGKPITLAADGRIVSCGSSQVGTGYTRTVKTNTTGTNVFASQVTPYSGESADKMRHESVALMNDGKFVFSGSYYGDMAGYSFILLSVSDSSGNMSYGKYFGGSDIVRTPGLDVYPSSGTTTGFIMSGYYQGTGGIDGFFIITGIDGSIISQKKYYSSQGTNKDDKFYSARSVGSSGFIIAGESNGVNLYGTNLDAVLISLDSSGNQKWLKCLGNVSYDDGFYDAVPTSDGGYLAAGYTEAAGAGGKDIWIVKFTSSGTVSWQRVYGGTSDDFANDILLLNDGSYLITGTTASFGTGTNIWLLKIDEAGNMFVNTSELVLAQSASIPYSGFTLSSTNLTWSDSQNIAPNSSACADYSSSAETPTVWEQFPQ